MKTALMALAVLLAGCGRYADFTLPLLPGGNPNLTYTLEEVAAPVLPRGDSPDALNPSMLATGELIYSEYDGSAWHTARAAADGAGAFRKTGRVLSPDPATWEGSYIAANGDARSVDGHVWYWYVAGRRDRPAIGFAVDWRKHPAPVLEPGPYMSWDEYGVADPYVVRLGEWLYMYYLGENRSWTQRIGVARSRDGIQWEKLRTNPVLEAGGPGAFDENGLGEPAVWQAEGYYWMLYTGRAADETRRLGLARSIDGAHWTKLPAVFSGANAWDAKVICDPTVAGEAGREVRIYFGGGDVARPDENIHGQIGAGILRMVAK